MSRFAPIQRLVIKRRKQVLTKISSSLYRAPSGSRIQIVSRSQNNNGVNDCRYRYDGAMLPHETIQGLPGCTFTLSSGRRSFEALVVFDPNGGSNARYDLFEIDANGNQIN